MTLACTFEGGKCVHCGATTRINSEWGECQGWNEPIISDRERELMAEVERLNLALLAASDGTKDRAHAEAYFRQAKRY